MDGEANHSITECPLPFQANSHPGMSPHTQLLVVMLSETCSIDTALQALVSSVHLLLQRACHWMMVLKMHWKG